VKRAKRRIKKNRAQSVTGSVALGEFEFVLRFDLPNPDSDPEQFVDDLHEAGCDDAICGIGQKGRIALDFTREAPTENDAIFSAIADVRRAIPGAKLSHESFFEWFAQPSIVGKYELVDGLPVLKAGDDRNHKRIVQNAMRSIRDQLEDAK
jgi:hypothetical protein